MSSKSYFICQVYERKKQSRGKGDVLAKGATHECASADDAVRKANKLFDSGSHVGVDAFTLEVDPEMGDYGDPLFLLRLGDVPQMDN